MGENLLALYIWCIFESWSFSGLVIEEEGAWLRVWGVGLGLGFRVLFSWIHVLFPFYLS